jgi:hypothetical protein
MPECTNQDTLATMTILFSVPIGALQMLMVKKQCIVNEEWEHLKVYVEKATFCDKDQKK